MNVLIAEDEESVRAHIASVLTREGFTCIEAADGLEAVKLFASHHPSLAVLDVMMPRADGYTACELMRNIEPAIPVMFLTAKGDVADRKAGYLAGADDYMAKPFDEEEFVLRVRALLRRSASEQHDSKARASPLF